MNYRHPLVALLLGVAIVACGSTGAPVSQSTILEQEFQLAAGEQATFAKPRLSVKFVRVVTDSRCARDTTCVWQGEVKVLLSTRLKAGEPVQHEMAPNETALVGDYRLLVVRVQPEPEASRQISPAEYRVTLRVE